MTYEEEMGAIEYCAQKGMNLKPSAFYRIGKKAGFISGGEINDDIFHKWVSDMSPIGWTSLMDICKKNGLNYSSVKNQVIHQGIEMKPKGERNKYHVRESDVWRIVNKCSPRS